MKRILLTSVFSLISLLAFCQNDILTNQSIVDLVEIGFSDEIIISKINESSVSFDTSVSGLKFLKKHNVSDILIVSIIDATKKRNVAKSKTQALKEGIYYVSPDGTEEQILPSVFSGTQRNFGMITDKVWAKIPYETSPNKISSLRPIFRFYFNKDEQSSSFSSGVDNWFFKVASSPNEFVLVEMIKKKGERRLEIGHSGSSDPSIISGVNNKKTIPFSIKKTGDSVYEIILQQDLKNGEYCFIYQGNMPSGKNNQSVFDFSID